MSESTANQRRNPWWAVFFLGFAVLLFVLTNRSGREPAPDQDPPKPPFAVMLTNTIRKDGLLLLKGTTNPVSGEVVERYRDGSLKSATYFVEGRLHGMSEGYYTNGQIQVREHFTNGVSHGVRTKWYDSGATQSVTTIVAGEHHGQFRRWHENGQLAQELNLVEGKADGLSRAWHTNGQLKAEVNLDNGKVLTQKFWNPDGSEPEK